MKSKRKTIVFSTLTAVGISATIFVIIGVVFDIIFNGNFQMDNYSFSKMAMGTLAIGLGFGLPTFVYENENMSHLVQTLIHMGIGCVVMTTTAFIVGWIPTKQGVIPMIAAISCEVAFAFVIWLFFYAHQKKLAKEMNQRIAEMNQ